MLNARLNIRGVDVPYLKEIPVSVNLSVTDIRNPESVHGSYSKTIQVPMSKEVDALFELIFEANVELNTFNPNLKEQATFYKEELVQFKGSAQLLKIVKHYDGITIPGYYEINVIGENGNIFLDIGDAYLTDLDFSDLNHAFTYANRNWTPTLGTGYAYPFIDYGFTGGNNSNWKYTDLKPSIFVREYLLRMFSDAGYTWSSSFFDSTFFKHLIIPDSNEGKLQLPFATVTNSQFYAGKTADTFTATLGGIFFNVVPGVWQFGLGGTSYSYLLTFNDDSTLPFNDPGNNYNTSSNVLTLPNNGYYTIVTNDTIEVTITAPTGTVTSTGAIFGGGPLVVNIQQSNDGGATWTTVASSIASLNGLAWGQTGTVNVAVQIPGNYYLNGTKFRCSMDLYAFGSNLHFYDVSNNEILGGSAALQFTQKSNSTFFCNLSVTDLPYGQTVDMNQTVPKDVKQKDFFKSIIQMFNLRIEPDRDDPTLLYIEPHGDFYFPASQALNWEKKFDSGKEIEVIPMGELDSRVYEWQYKSDKDIFNTKYEDEFKRTYGKMWLNVANDFIKNTKTTEVIFSGTPIAAYASNNMVVPHFYQQDGTQTKNIKVNIRILYWGGLKNCNGYNLDVNGSVNVQSSYPYAGHVDDPYTPTLDLCFRYPSRIYWTIPAQTYTNNGLYGAYWSKFITEITDKNSKILIAYFNLDESDINLFTFRKLIYADLGGGGAYYYVNKIIDYNPLVREVTKVELLKVKNADTFVGIEIGGELGGSGLGAAGGMDANGGFYDIIPTQPEFSFVGNYNQNQSESAGFNNINLGYASQINGDENFVG